MHATATTATNPALALDGMTFALEALRGAFGDGKAPSERAGGDEGGGNPAQPVFEYTLTTDKDGADDDGGAVRTHWFLYTLGLQQCTYKSTHIQINTHTCTQVMFQLLAYIGAQLVLGGRDRHHQQPTDNALRCG